MTKKRYRIGDFAKLVGVSAETLRHYDRIGLVLGSKDESNDYRYYDHTDIARIILIRKLRGEGFSLPETLNYLNRMTLEEQVSTIDEKIHQLEKETEELTQKINHLRKYRKSCLMPDCRLDTVYETTLPRSIRHHIAVLTDSSEARRLLPEMFAARILPSSITLTFSQQKAGIGPFCEPDTINMVLTDTADVDIKDRDSIQVRDSGPGLMMRTIVKDIYRVPASVFRAFVDHADKAGYRLSGNFHAQIQAMTNRNGEMDYYIAVRIKIAPRSRNQP